MKKDRALQLIKEVFDSLDKESLPGGSVMVNSDTLLLGNNSPLDSIGFVTFVTALEERLVQETKNDDISLVLNEIGDFNASNPVLSVDTLAWHIVKLTGEGNGGKNSA